ncbi:MAG: hypothetical protein LBJ17_02565 [Dysgonamonadaceae bacterium]|nr:hypothetical protein [Dysgonamonadaceae bacterium]
MKTDNWNYSPSFLGKQYRRALLCGCLFLQNTRLYFDGLEELEKAHLGCFNDTESNKVDTVKLEQGIKKHLSTEASYSLVNWKKIREMSGMSNDPDVIIPEVKLFHYENVGRRNNKKIHEHYQNWCELLRVMLEKKYGIPKICISLATWSSDNEKNELALPANLTANSSISLSELDIITFSAQHEKDDEPTAKTIIKGRIIDAINETAVNQEGQKIKSDNGLTQVGYTVRYFSNVKDLNHRVPYIILSFENPVGVKSEAEKFLSLRHAAKRGLEPIVPIFLYISYQGNEIHGAEGVKKAKIPWLIARDVLSKRNRLMRMFGADFNSDAISDSAHLALAEAILKTERAASHTPASFDTNLADILARPIDKIIQWYPELKQENAGSHEDFVGFKILQWDLFRLYVDSQIAKLFNRRFDTLIAKQNYMPASDNADAPHLYVKATTNGNSLFDEPLIRFNDLAIPVNDKNSNDERMNLLKSIICFDIADDVVNAELFVGENSERFNVEYFKCILFSIIFDAIRYYSPIQSDFLKAIEELHVMKKQCKPCTIKIKRKKENAQFDYLVITHSADPTTPLMSNDRITNKLKNPLDFSNDGRISLWTIKGYTEGIDSKLKDRFEMSIKPPPEDCPVDCLYQIK